MRKYISKLMLALVLLVQMMVSAVAFAEYNKELERVYGIWGIPNSGYSMEFNADTIGGEGYTIVDAYDTGKMIYATLGTGDGAVEIMSDGKTMRFTMNGETTTLKKYYRGDDGKLYPY